MILFQPPKSLSIAISAGSTSIFPLKNGACVDDLKVVLRGNENQKAAFVGRRRNGGIRLFSRDNGKLFTKFEEIAAEKGMSVDDVFENMFREHFGMPLIPEPVAVGKIQDKVTVGKCQKRRDSFRMRSGWQPRGPGKSESSTNSF